MEQHSVGTRVSLNGDLGTIKYVGSVDNTRGSWLGVEWDNPERGKHDGCKDGKRYFTCRFSTSGSFIRPTSHIVYGVSFLDALSSKYIDTLHGPAQENIILGSSAGAIRVEAVSLDKVREKFARLDRLREASLDNANVVKGDPPGSILKTCPNIRGLDLSQNLLPSWETVAQITRELPVLERLSLNRNRLQKPNQYESLTSAFIKLIEIQLNDTLITWTEMQTITASMPQLQVIEMGYNRLTALGGDKPPTSMNSSIHFINLDSNFLSDWVHICASMREYKSLQRVVLTSNCIETIPFPKNPSDCLAGLKYLSVSDNRICGWDAIDALSSWFPALESLIISGNPLITVDASGNQSRPLLIARIPSLCVLDGAAISPRERTDSELFYMSTIIQQGIVSDEVRMQKHPRWSDLCKKHGKPDEVQEKQKVQNKLSSQLIDLKLYRYDQWMGQNSTILPDPEAALRVLPSMSLRIMRLKICKVLKVDARRTNIIFWLHMGHGVVTKLDTEHDTRDIDWLGIDSDSHILYQVQ